MSIPHHRRNIGELRAAHMVEFENNTIRFAAIDARMRQQILGHKCAVRGPTDLLILTDAAHLTVVVLPMPIGLVFGEARFAPSLKSMRATTPSREVRPGLELPAIATSQQIWGSDEPSGVRPGRVERCQLVGAAA